MRKIYRIKNHWLIKKHIKCFYYHNYRSRYPRVRVGIMVN